METPPLAVIVLAAGRATRMGHAKQLLKYKGKTLLARAIENGIEVSEWVLVVLGAYQDAIKPEAKKYPINLVINHHYQEGLSSSIHAGILVAKEILPDVSGVLITLVDQPEITASHLKELVRSGLSRATIAATSYAESIGVPAYFPQRYLQELSNLTGDSGARVLLEKYRDLVFAIPFEGAAKDIDTEQDWLDFLHPNHRP